MHVPTVTPQRLDLRRADLSSAVLPGASLAGSDLAWSNLTGADLSGAQLLGANLSGANLRGARLSRADLRGAQLEGCDASGANLEGANLSSGRLFGAQLQKASMSQAVLANANMSQCDLSGSDLSGSDIRSAQLFRANLVNVNLSYADLSGADLYDADFGKVICYDTRMSGANLSSVHLSQTVLADVDLSQARGLTDLQHAGPSIVDHRTLTRSGALPTVFLRGVGLADWQIEEAKLLQPDLTPTEITDIMYRVIEKRGAYPLQVRPVFISYSHADAAFVDVLEAELNAVGIRFWRDIHDMEAGPLEPQVHRAMEDRVAVIVLSAASTQSDWVEHEVKHARELAKTQGRYTLCPIALDDSWRRCAWPQRLREQLMEYAILDFSGWQDRKRMGTMFVKLERGLRKWYR